MMAWLLTSTTHSIPSYISIAEAEKIGMLTGSPTICSCVPDMMSKLGMILILYSKRFSPSKYHRWPAAFVSGVQSSPCGFRRKGRLPI